MLAGEVRLEVAYGSSVSLSLVNPQVNAFSARCAFAGIATIRSNSSAAHKRFMMRPLFLCSPLAFLGQCAASYELHRVAASAEGRNGL